MNHDPNSFVVVVQSAFLELLELTDEIARCDCAENQELFRDEAEKTVLMFIAAIVLASREYKPEDRSFLSLLVNWQKKPGGEARYLNEYATRWVEEAKSVPKFFSAAVRYDFSHETNIARSMLCQIQLIGNNTSVADGNACGARRDVVRDYLVLLEDFLELKYAQLTVADNFSNDVIPLENVSTPQHRNEPKQPDEARPPAQAGGSIGYLGLVDWWSAEFSREERAYIVSR